MCSSCWENTSVSCLFGYNPFSVAIVYVFLLLQSYTFLPKNASTFLKNVFVPIKKGASWVAYNGRR